MKEPFDSFEYIKPADYLPALKERYQEENQGFEDAEAFAKVNDQQRMANAKIFGRAIDNAAKFSKSMADHLKTKRDENELAFENEAFHLAMKSGVTLDGYKQYKESENNLRADHTFQQYAAAEAYNNGDSELYESIRNLSGWQSVVFKRVVARQWTADWETNFRGENGINAQDANGNYVYTLPPRDDGTVVHWGNANISEKSELIALYNEKTGYSEVRNFKPEFATDTFWEKHQQNIAKVLGEENAKILVEQKNDRFNEYSVRLIAAAGTGDFAKEVHEIMVTEGAYAASMGDLRTELKELVKGLVLQGELDAGEISLDGYTFDRNDGATVELTSFKEFATWDVDSALLQDKLREVETAKENTAMEAYVNELYSKVEESGEMLSEKDKPAIVADFQSKFPNIPYERWPAEIKDIISKEDVADADYEATLQYKYDNSIPITRKDYIYIYNAETREKWRKIAQTAAGEGVETGAKRDRDVHSLVGETLQELKGTKEEKTLEFNTLKDRALAFYNTKYAQLIKGWDPDDMAGLHAEIISQLKLAIPRMDTQLAGPEDTTTYKRSIVAARKFIIGTEKDGNISHADRLSNELLPDSEVHMNKLIAYASNPERSSIPHYYYAVASHIKGMSAYDVAALQYKKQTGKDLPKPFTVKEIETLSLPAQLMLKNKPTNNTKVQVNILEGNANANSEEFLTDGLDLEGVLKYSSLYNEKTGLGTE